MTEESIPENSRKKFCSSCGTEKEIDDFPIDKTRPGGHRAQCHLCREASKRQWKQQHPENVERYQAAFYSRNPDYRRSYMRTYRAENPDIIKKTRKTYYVAHKEEMLVKSKEWKRENRDRLRERNCLHSREWRLANPEKSHLISKRSAAKRRLNPGVKLHQSISAGVGRSLNGGKNGRSWETLVGYTCEQLRRHLERRFLPGMTWDNYGEWHVDHKIPVSAFNFTTVEDRDFKKLSAGRYGIFSRCGHRTILRKVTA